MWPFVCVPGVLGEYMVRIGFFVTRGAVLCLAAGLSLAPLGAQAQTAEPYKPTIWIDPDGCEHWVMDDGLEGYMDNHLTREGRPVCRKTEVCGIMNTDQFFATDSARLSRPAQENWRNSSPIRPRAPLLLQAIPIAGPQMNITCASAQTVPARWRLWAKERAPTSSISVAMANGCLPQITPAPKAGRKIGASKFCALNKGFADEFF